MHPRATKLIDELRLQPHPEGGHYRRTRTSQRLVDAAGMRRPQSTEILYLLAAGEASTWHRIDAKETWRWCEGCALQLTTFDEAGDTLRQRVLGPVGETGVAQAVVPAGVWQSARPAGDYVLVACRVAPGFVWEGFELLDEGSRVARELSCRGALHSPGRTR